jgi:hypothetical protein
VNHGAPIYKKGAIIVSAIEKQIMVNRQPRIEEWIKFKIFKNEPILL